VIADFETIYARARDSFGGDLLPLDVTPSGPEKVTIKVAQQLDDNSDGELTIPEVDALLGEMAEEFGQAIDLEVIFQYSANIPTETVRELYERVPQPSFLKKVMLEENRNRVRIWYKHPEHLSQNSEALVHLSDIFPTYRIELCYENGTSHYTLDPKPPQVDISALDVINAHFILAGKILHSRNLAEIAKRLVTEQESLKGNDDVVRKFDKLKNSAISQLEKLEQIRNDPFSAATVAAINYNLKGFFRFMELIDFYNAGQWKKVQITFNQLRNSWESFLNSVDAQIIEDVDNALKAGNYDIIFQALSKINAKFGDVAHLEQYLKDEAYINLGFERKDLDSSKMQLDRTETALAKGNIATAVSNLDKVVRSLKRTNSPSKYHALFLEDLQMQLGWLKILQRVIPETISLIDINLRTSENVIYFRTGPGGIPPETVQEIKDQTSALPCILEPFQPSTELWDRLQQTETVYEKPVAVAMLPAEEGILVVWPNFAKVSSTEAIKMLLESALRYPVFVSENAGSKYLPLVRFKNVQKLSEELLNDLVKTVVPADLEELEFDFNNWPERIAISYASLDSGNFDLNAFAANLKRNLGINVDLFAKQTPEEVKRIVENKLPDWVRLAKVEPNLEENKVIITISNDYSYRPQVVEFEKSLREDLNLKVYVKFRFDEDYITQTVRYAFRSFFAVERVDLRWSVVDQRPKVAGVVASGFFLYPVSMSIVQDVQEDLQRKFELPIDLRVSEDVSVRTELNFINKNPDVKEAIFAPGWQPETPISPTVPNKVLAGSNRKDFTSWRTFTIDSDGSTMLEDALSIEKLPGDPPRYLVGVHITDPLWIIGEYPEIEEQAFRLARTVYLQDEPRFLFPRELSKYACSLRAGEAHPCVSFLIQVNENGFVEDWKIVRSVINPVRNFSYSEVNRAYFSNIGNFLEEFQILYQIAAGIWEYRVDNGGIRLSRYTEWHPGQRIVEEMMILANRVAALELAERNPPEKRIFRSQPIEVDDYLAIKVFLQDFQDEEVNFLNRSPNFEISRLIQTIEDRKQRELVFKKISQIIPPAEYSVTPQMHFLLGIPFYTSCTSPLRRFADFMVLRLLMDPDYKPRNLEIFCRHCTAMERIGRYIEGQVHLDKTLFALQENLGAEQMLDRVWGRQAGPCFFQLTAEEIFLRYDGEVPDVLFNATQEGPVLCIIDHVSRQTKNTTLLFPDLDLQLEFEVEVLRSFA